MKEFLEGFRIGILAAFMSVIGVLGLWKYAELLGLM